MNDEVLRLLIENGAQPEDLHPENPIFGGVFEDFDDAFDALRALERRFDKNFDDLLWTGETEKPGAMRKLFSREERKEWRNCNLSELTDFVTGR